MLCDLVVVAKKQQQIMALTEDGAAAAAKKERQERRKRKRWGTKQPEAAPSSNHAAAVTAAGNADATSSSSGAPTTTVVVDPAKAKILAMQESVRARLAAAHKAQQQNNKRPAPESQNNKSAKRAKVYELDLTVTAPSYQKETQEASASATAAAAAASVARKKKTKKPKPSNPYLAHQQQEEEDSDDAADFATNDDTAAQDERLPRASKPPRQHHKQLVFVAPGTYQELAELKRERASKAAAAGFLSGRKQGHTIQSVGATAADIYSGSGMMDATSDAAEDPTATPRADAHPDTTMPLVMEWWDSTELLPSKLKKQLAAAESRALTRQTQQELASQLAATTAAAASKNSSEDASTVKEAAKDIPKGGADDSGDNIESLRSLCWEQASLSHSKTAALVQHIVPVQPPNANAVPPKQAVLHLTKKERKRLRKQRRQEKQRELQDLQAAGLVPAPEPRLTLQNFMQVLGEQSVLDPSQMEQRVQEQMRARQRAHLERNAAAKLTKEQRAAKRAAKVQKDADSAANNQAVTVALYFVLDMSHPYHRSAVDLNAQQLQLTGLVLECYAGLGACLVVVEGGPKAIQKFHRLMTVRLNWTGPGEESDDDDDDDEPDGDDGDDAKPQHKFNPANRCEPVWQGLAVHRLFHGFLFQAVDSPAQARKILKAKGAEHYWDQVVQHATGQSDRFQLKLAAAAGDDDDEEKGEDNPFAAAAENGEEDIVMKDA